MMIALAMTIIFIYLLAIPMDKDCEFMGKNDTPTGYIVNGKFFAILIVGFLTYLMDFIVRGLILYGITRDNPFV